MGQGPHRSHILSLSSRHLGWHQIILLDDGCVHLSNLPSVGSW